MPEAFANSSEKPATKHLAAESEPASTTIKEIPHTSEKATSKKPAETAEATTKKTSQDFENATTAAPAKPTTTHATSSTHASSSSSVPASSSVPSSTMLPAIISASSVMPTVASSSSAALPSATSTASQGSSTNVAGPVVGSLAGVAVVGAAAFFFLRRRNKQKRSRASHAFSQFLNEAPQHHGDGNARDSIWGMPGSKGNEKEMNNGYAISPPPPAEKTLNSTFAPAPMSPPAAYSPYDPQQQHHTVSPNASNADTYVNTSPQQQYGNVSPAHSGGHNAALAGAAAGVGLAAGGALAAHAHHQQQYPNEVNGDMPLSAPAPYQQDQHATSANDLQSQQLQEQQHSPSMGYNQQPQPMGYGQQPQPMGYDQQSQPVGYDQQAQSAGYDQQSQPMGYDQHYGQYQDYQSAQYYDPNTQQYMYSQQQPYSQYNSMYIGADQGYYQPDQQYQQQYPADAAAAAFAHPANSNDNSQQQSYEMIQQPQTVNSADNTVHSTPEQSNQHIEEPSQSLNAVTPQPEQHQAADAGHQAQPADNTHTEHSETNEPQAQSTSPYVLDVPLNNHDPARETLYGLSETYQYDGDETGAAQEVNSGSHNMPPQPPSHSHDESLM